MTLRKDREKKTSRREREGKRRTSSFILEGPLLSSRKEDADTSVLLTEPTWAGPSRKKQREMERRKRELVDQQHSVLVRHFQVFKKNRRPRQEDQGKERISLQNEGKEKYG